MNKSTWLFEAFSIEEKDSKVDRAKYSAPWSGNLNNLKPFHFVINGTLMKYS